MSENKTHSVLFRKRCGTLLLISHLFFLFALEIHAGAQEETTPTLIVTPAPETREIIVMPPLEAPEILAQKEATSESWIYKEKLVPPLSLSDSATLILKCKELLGKEYSLSFPQGPAWLCSRSRSKYEPHTSSWPFL